MFWDNDCENIIGKTADDMRKAMLEEGEDGPMVYPNELDSLLNKKMDFRVKVQPNFSQTLIHKLDTNESIVNQIVNDYVNYEHSMSACGENELDFNNDVTPIKVNSSVSRDIDVNYDIVGYIQYLGTKPPKKVKVEPNY
ncbi:hypothetical protein KIW84_011429 [Lathyrus oleraceus]|uniref:Uncharacterized protein n=1 Tax=Pisum sativum TaxID=3888 RepID=A0A9D5GUQ5_PEA|nr:hypothetical protein KIW84_011429 [Pisum sativum]